MRQRMLRCWMIGMAGAAGLLGMGACSPADNGGASASGESGTETAAVSTSGAPAARAADPWMSGARWGMTLDEVLSAVGTNVVRHTASSVYYFIQLDGSPALSQYVFSTDGQLVRQILYLANPKREAYLPKQTLDEVEKNFERFRRLLEARYGAAAVVTQAVAVSGRLESQSRTVRDQIAATKEEIRGLEAQMETRRRELQREFIGERDRNARVVAGLSDLERTLQQAQRRLRSFEGEFGQIQTAIRAETAELPEGTRPFHWESNWENGTAVVTLYLTVNPRGNYLALSLTDPGSTP